MTGLSAHLEDYLALRRGLGFRLERPGQILEGFVGYLEQAGAATVTSEHALAWATAPAGADPAWWRRRLAAVRPFARYLAPRIPGTEVPPRGLLPGPSSRRAVPYLYSDAEVAALVAAAAAIRTPFRAATYQALIGLLAVTGMRVGEAIGLDRGDLDAGQGLVTIRSGKFGKSRQLPLHPSALEALTRYARLRDRAHRRPAAPAFLLSTGGDTADLQERQRHLPQARRRRGAAAAVGGVPAADPRPAPHLRGHDADPLVRRRRRRRRPAALAVGLARARSPGRHLLVLTGTPELLALAAARARPALQENSDDSPRPRPAGVLHRAARPAAARQRAHRSPPTATPGGCCSPSRPSAPAKPPVPPRLHRPRRPRRSPPSSTTWKTTAATASGPATPGWRRSTRCSATRRCATPSTPPLSPASWPSPPSAPTGPWSPGSPKTRPPPCSPPPTAPTAPAAATTPCSTSPSSPACGSPSSPRSPRDDLHLGAGPHVTCHGKGRKQRVTPLTAAAVTVMRDMAGRTARQQGPDRCSQDRTNSRLSRDAVERRLSLHAAAATAGCPSLAAKKISPHVLRHTAAMRLLHAGVEVSVIALWLGHEQTETAAHLPARRPRPQGKSPRTHHPARRQPRPLPATRPAPGLPRKPLNMPTPTARPPQHQRRGTRQRHNPQLGIMPGPRHHRLGRVAGRPGR